MEVGSRYSTKARHAMCTWLKYERQPMVSFPFICRSDEAMGFIAGNYMPVLCYAISGYLSRYKVLLLDCVCSPFRSHRSAECSSSWAAALALKAAKGMHPTDIKYLRKTHTRGGRKSFGQEKGGLLKGQWPKNENRSMLPWYMVDKYFWAWD